MSEDKAKELELRCAALEKIITDIHWMARRYADGRSTYATGMLNDAIRSAKALGLNLRAGGDGLLFARDSMGRAYDGLSEAEANPPGARAADSWVDEDVRRLRIKNAALAEALLGAAEALTSTDLSLKTRSHLAGTYKALVQQADVRATGQSHDQLPPPDREKNCEPRGQTPARGQ